MKYLMIRRFALLSLVLAVLWLTKMRSLAGSLADGVLAEAILIPPRPPIPPTNIRRGRGRRKSTETKKRKEEMLGWLNASLKCMETRLIPIPANFKMPVSDANTHTCKFQDACQRLMLHPYLHHSLTS